MFADESDSLWSGGVESEWAQQRVIMRTVATAAVFAAAYAVVGVNGKAPPGLEAIPFPRTLEDAKKIHRCCTIEPIDRSRRGKGTRCTAAGTSQALAVKYGSGTVLTLPLFTSCAVPGCGPQQREWQHTDML